ncbi:membrane protein [Arenimonas soli]|uniref:Membrane protein n=1 Tax=Arenimonas soli TaxID=2269504 RepID=A0ABQ1HRB0_9GAMM|nr:TolC family outer membrane protein [Arenimonas soli]GGA87077.1 membrane protein [Arenimonas soli]
MRLSLRPLASAILLAGAAGSVSAADLMDAFQMARESDPVLAAAESQRLATGENVVQARARLLPQISASASLTDSRVRGQDMYSRDRSYGASLSQSLYDYGNYTSLNASKLRDEQAAFQLRAQADNLIVRVADAYFNVLTAIETLVSSRAEERSVKRQLDQADKRLEVGLAPITDVHEARARYDSARANAIAAATALEDAHEALAEITGVRLDNMQGLEPGFVPKNTIEGDAAEWVSIATESNPNLLAAELALAAAERDIRTARSGHLPTLSASASIGDNAGWQNQYPGGPNTSGGGSTVGVTLSVPLYAGGAVQSGVRQAVHGRDIAADQLEQERRAVVRFTRNAQRSLVAGEAEVEARRLSVVSAQAAYEASEAGLEVGTRTIVDVLIGQQALFQAQREYARARHAFLVNTLRLRQAAGTITVEDLQAVNSVLTADAEAPLVMPASEDGE